MAKFKLPEKLETKFGLYSKSKSPPATILPSKCKNNTLNDFSISKMNFKLIHKVKPTSYKKNDLAGMLVNTIDQSLLQKDLTNRIKDINPRNMKSSVIK